MNSTAADCEKTTTRRVTPAFDPERRLFSGMYPGGIVFSDRFRERGGDYARAAFLPYHKLELEFEKDCPKAMRTEIEANVASMDLRRGNEVRIAGNRTVILGNALPAA